MKALEWLNEQGGEQVATLGDGTAVVAHVEKFHPITDELSTYIDSSLPEKTLDLDVVRVLSGDDIIELSESIDENGFLMSLGYVSIGDYDGGVILLNANDSSVHVLELELLDLSRAEMDEGSGEYFWDGEPLEEGSDGFEMVFEECCTQFASFEEFDEVLTGLLKGEVANEELGI